ncbi:dihydroorotase [Hoeflea prorocentri]|uniref:Dihydroorotase n=1 Tax=Hoeflea prorocentri TaxID=1922333 RepID=A0A9X3ZGQ9_9HYPH|nr:dihydroorotase [Hoeflea prorocentri]MCY6380489.1 dihydroorotase [Hoeflea prorocentri]MDA5398289.1 dihydroorotase [Hoeflea prorocentri]
MSAIALKNARIVDPSQDLDAQGDIVVADGLVAACGSASIPADAREIDCTGKLVIPGLVDARVFVGEPGAEHRETIASVSHAAAAGGVTSLIMMPDTTPPIDDVALVEFVLRTAREQACVNIFPSAALTKRLEGRELTEFGLLRDAGAVMLTNGRQPVGNALVLRRAMTYARDFGLVVACETQDEHLAAQGVMNEGLFASWLGLEGVPREAEVIPLERDLRLAALTGAHYHAAKISTSDSVDTIRAARARGATVTCGVSINHLSLNENDIGEYRTFFRLSPPLRGEDDRRAMVEAIASGDIDIIVSSHDPQDVDTKRHPFADAADGAVGLETMLAAALRLHHSGDVSLPRLIDAMSTRPAHIFGLDCGTLKPGSRADLAIVDPDEPWIVSKEELKSRSKNTPFEDARFQGRVTATMVAGSFVYEAD